MYDTDQLHSTSGYVPPAPARNRSTLRTVLTVLGAVAVVLLVVGLIAGIAAGRSKLAKTEDRLAAATATTADLRDRVSGLGGEAISLGVKMDGVLNDLVDNVLYNRSVSEYISLQSRYSALGSDWEDAASTCAPGGGYSFS
jgi:hypothetical protein